MSAGAMILTISAVLVFCGLLQRVLDRMYLSDRQALLLIGIMIAGTLLPNVNIGNIVVNIGGFLIPVGICIYLIYRADSFMEKKRAVIGTLLTGLTVYMISLLFPSEAETMPIDPMWLYGIAGGIIAWITGRSRRAAFICGILGVFIADVVSFSVAWLQGYHVQLILGGAGIADAAVISGVVAVLMCELIGEVIERIIRRQGRWRQMQ